MSLIHRGGRVDPPSIVQPDSCPSVLTPSLPHYLPPLVFSLFFLPGPYLFRSFLIQSLGRAAKVKQVTKTSAINQRFDTSEPPPSFEASRGPKSNQNACPISGQRYVRVAPCCFFCAPFSVSCRGPCPPIQSSSHVLLAATAAAAAVVHRNLACRRSRTRGRGFARSLVPWHGPQ